MSKAPRLNVKEELQRLRDLTVQLEKAPTKRRRLPVERQSLTKLVKIPGEQQLKLYATVSFFEDGTIGELFLKADRVGSFASGVLDGFAILVSLALQHGVPLGLICSKLVGTKFEPAGVTGDAAFPIVSSPLDYIARWLLKLHGSDKKGKK